MTDPRAAERARRYRARQRDRQLERDAAVTSRAPGAPGIEAQLVEVVAELRALRAAIAELVEASYPQSAPIVGKRDVTARHAVQRDVTERHAAEGARTYAGAPTRVRTRLSGPTGPREPLVDRERDAVTRAVTPAEAVLVELRRAPGPASVGAIADAIDAPASSVAVALGELVGAGLVRRIPAETIRERDRWAPVVVESPAETIRCEDYQAHRFDHRREPDTGRFRCYVCEPAQLVAPI